MINVLLYVAMSMFTFTLPESPPRNMRRGQKAIVMLVNREYLQVPLVHVGVQQVMRFL